MNFIYELHCEKISEAEMISQETLETNWKGLIVVLTSATELLPKNLK